MLKTVKINILIVLAISLTFTSGCEQKFIQSKNVEANNDKKISTIPQRSKKSDIELEIWSWFNFNETIEEFEAKNSGIKVKRRVFPFEDCDEEYMKALANGTAPDIFVFDSSFFGKYTVDGFLQNLLEEPFSAEKYKDDFLGWESGFSFYNTELLSISYSTAPYITMYRADVMKENGFPSEPEEFGEFIENPDNLLQIAIKLKQQGKYIFQNPTDITDIVGATMGYFDDDLNYIREGDLFAKSIDFTREIYNNQVISNRTFWFDEGKKAVSEGKLVMLFLASYTMIELEECAPEQKEKWRVAKAPLGLNAWGTDTKLSINKQSEHKKEAWKLLEHIVTSVKSIENVVPSYIPALSNEAYLGQEKEFFGDQKIYSLISEIAKDMTQYKVTPLDKKANNMYLDGMWEILVEEYNAYEGIEKMKKEIEKEIAEEKKMLLKEVD